MAYMETPRRGQWRVRWRDATGALRSSSRFTDKTKAQVCLEECAAREEARRPAGVGEPMSLAALVESFINARLADDRASELHLDRNARKVLQRLFAARGWARLSDLRTGQVTGLKLGEHRALKAVLRHAKSIGQPVEDGLVWLKPPKRVRKPQRDLLRPEQVAALVDAAAEWCPASGALAHMLATYGHRPQTAVQTRVKDVDLERGLISLEVKGGDKLRHPLLPATIDWLRPLVEGRAPEAFLFIGHDGQPWGTGQRLAQWWHHYVGGKTTPDQPGVYNLKRYAISSMLERGLAPKTICSITGHRTPATLHLYARTNEDRQREALAALATLPSTARRIAGQ